MNGNADSVSSGISARDQLALWILEAEQNLPHINPVPPITGEPLVFGLHWPALLASGPVIDFVAEASEELLSGDPSFAARFVALHFAAGWLKETSATEEPDLADCLNRMVLAPQVVDIVTDWRTMLWEIHNAVYVRDFGRVSEILEYASAVGLIDTTRDPEASSVLALTMCDAMGAYTSGWGGLEAEVACGEAQLLDFEIPASAGLGDATWRAACEQFRETTIHLSQTPLVRIANARFSFLLQDYASAQRTLDALLASVGPDHEDQQRLRGALACVHEQAGDLDRAQRLYLELRDADPRKVGPATRLASFLIRAEQHERADQVVRTILELAPEDAASWRYAQEFYSKRADYFEAERCYVKLLDLDPHFAASQPGAEMVRALHGIRGSEDRLARIEEYFEKSPQQIASMAFVVAAHWPEFGSLSDAVRDRWCKAMCALRNATNQPHAMSVAPYAAMLVAVAVESALKEAVFRPFAEAMRGTREFHETLQLERKIPEAKLLHDLVRRQNGRHAETGLSLGEMAALFECARSPKTRSVIEFQSWVEAKHPGLTKNLPNINLKLVQEKRNAAAHEDKAGMADVMVMAAPARELLTLVALDWQRRRSPPV